jgi:hypothetical protein
MLALYDKEFVPPLPRRQAQKRRARLPGTPAARGSEIVRKRHYRGTARHFIILIRYSCERD